MLAKEDLTHDGEDGIYWMETEDLGLELTESQMNEANLAFAGEVVEAYPDRAEALAAWLAADKDLAPLLGSPDAGTIEEKLGRPVIRIDQGRIGRLSFLEQTLDEGHILDVEFGGVLEEFWNAGLDG